MDDLENFVMQRMPTANRPLLGLTILVVEDSRFACEAIRLMCIRSGGRIRRADCLRSARRHLRMYRPAVVILDLGLPDGSGIELIEELADCSPKIGVVIGTSGDDGAGERALKAGADGFLAKPVSSLAEFQNCILQHLPREVQPSAPRVVPNETLTPDRIALKDDLAHVVDLLDHGPPEGPVIDYVAQFLGGVAVSAEDTTLLSAARALGAARQSDGAVNAALLQLSSILKDRIDKTLVV